MSELAQRLEAWGRNNVAHQEGRDWHEFLGLVASVEGLDERLAEEQREHSKLAAASCKPNEIRCIYCDATVCTEPDAPSPEDTLTTRVKSVEHDATCESNPLAARVRELDEKVTWRDKLLEQCQAQCTAREKRLSVYIDGLERQVTALEAENEALTKRVAELESHLSDTLQFNVTLAKSASALQHQLAWTPVAQGLPTEPGYYLCDHPDAGLTLYELTESELYPWRNIAGARRKTEDMSRLYEHFRRITLPEAT